MVADRDDGERKPAVEEDADDGDDQVSGREPCAAPADVGPQRREGEQRREHNRDDPASVLREDVVRDVVDLVARDPDHALGAEDLDDHSLADQEPRQRDDERRHAEERDDRPLNCPDPRAEQNRQCDRDEPRIVVARAGQLELGHRDARETAQVADGEIDLADQQHEDDADRDHRHPGHLADQVHEVDRGEEDRRLRREVRGDRDDPDDHRQAADVAALQGLPARPQYGAEAVAGGGGLDLCRRGGAHDAAGSVAVPAVIACTISCSVVFSRS